MNNLKLKSIVTDTWWPWRQGRVVKRLKTVVHVQWLDNDEITRYDRPHLQFLKVMTYFATKLGVTTSHVVFVLTKLEREGVVEFQNGKSAREWRVK